MRVVTLAQMVEALELGARRARPVHEYGDWPNDEQHEHQRNMHHGYGHERRKHDQQVGRPYKLPVTELKRDREQKSDGGGGNAEQKGSRVRIATVLFPYGGQPEHYDCTRQYKSRDCDHSAERTAQTVADDHADVDRIKAWERFGDLERVKELLVAEPFLIAYDVFTEIRDYAAAETYGAGREEDREDLAQAYGASNRPRLIHDS